MVQESLNLLDIARRQFDAAAETLGLEGDLREVLKTPERTLEVRVPVRMDDGSIRVFTGWRCQHNTARGPAKGGLRYHPDLTIDAVKALASWMTWKCAVMGIPYGGGKGGIRVEPRELTMRELERMTRRFTSEIGSVIGPERDIPAPDLNTNAQVMAWILDTYSMSKGYCVPGVVTGKPLALGGSLGRDEATGRGTVICIVETAQRLGIDIASAKTAVQGFGQVGRPVARLLAKRGAKVVAVSDAAGGVFDGDGLDIDALEVHVHERGGVADFPGSKPITNEELLLLDVDILVPAAVENVITARNARDVKARIIGEGANGPTTPEADDILWERRQFVIPDILANAGGVTVSYFEWVQNVQELYWTIKDVNRRLLELMVRAYQSVYDIHLRHGCSMRRAAWIMGVDRVAEAHRLRGLYP